MKISTEIDHLHDKDIYSLLLFALYKATDTPEYSALSQLAYILDKDNLLKFLEFFGGMTLKVPKIEELEYFVYALLLFQWVDVEKIPYDEALQKLKGKALSMDELESKYFVVRDCVRDYNFNSGRN